MAITLTKPKPKDKSLTQKVLDLISPFAKKTAQTIGKQALPVPFLPGSVKRPTIGQTAKFAQESLIQAPAQFGAGVALSARKQSSYTPDNPISKFVMGEKPVKNIQGQGADLSRSLQQVGVPRGVSEKVGVPGVVALGLLNVLPGGGAKKTTAKSFVEHLAGRLTPAQGEAAASVVKNLDNVTGNYAKRVLERFGNPNVISADEVKHVIPGFKAEASGDFHEASSALAKAMYDEKLAASKGKGNNTVMFMSGGTGSGKTTAIRKTAGDLKDYPIVYDTNLTGKGAIDKVKKAVDNGYDVDIVYVQRDPVTAFEKGVLPRVRTEGRVIEIPEHIKRHKEAYNTLEQIKNEFGDKVNITYIDNTRGLDEVKEVTLDNLPKFNYNDNVLSTTLNEKLSQAVQKGEITTTEADAIRAGRPNTPNSDVFSGEPQAQRQSGTLTSQPSFEQAASHIAERINPTKRPGGISLGKVKEKAADVVTQLKSSLVDSFAPIEDTINQLEKKGKFKVAATQDPRLLRNRVLGATDIGKQMLKQDLEPVIKQVGPKNLDEFDRYLAARQAMDVEQYGKATGIDPAQAQVYVDGLKGKYEGLANQVTGYTRKVLNYVKEGGLISDDLYNYLVQKYPNYVPLNRIMDEIDTVVAAPSKSVGSLSRQTIVQKLKGSEREIESPLSSIVEKSISAADQVERNRVAQGIAGLRNYEGFQDVIKPVAEAGKKNTISVFENGEKHFYEVPEAFAEAAKNLNKDTMNIVTKIFSIPVRSLRIGLTGLNLPFIASNVVRDQLFSILTSKKATTTANPFVFGKALFDTMGSKGAYDDFLAAGGGMSNFFSQGRAGSKPIIKEFATGTGSKVAKTITDPRKWMSSIEDLVGKGEQTTRTQQFLGTRQALGETGKIDPFAAPTEAGLKAVQAGRENTVDFAKKGALGPVLNSVFIYMNAGIQGARTMLRSFKTDPIGTSVKLAGTVYAPVAAATLWNTATPERKQAYMDIPQWERNNNIIILPPDPKVDSKGKYVGAIKIPLPQSFSSLTVPIRAGIEYLSGVDQTKVSDALSEFFGGALVGFTSPGSFVSRATPTALTPIVEQHTNTELFTGAPLVPQAKQGLAPKYQYREDTSGTMRLIGEKLNLPPAVLQNYAQKYGGEVALQVLNAIDTGLAKAGVIPQENIAGRSLVEGIVRRFGKAKTGQLSQDDIAEIQKISQEEKTKAFVKKEGVKKLVEKLKTASPDQANKQLEAMDDITYKAVKKMIESDRLDSTEKQIKGLGVQSGARARYIYGEVKKISSRDARNTYLNQLETKGLISDDVYTQLQSLIAGQ